MHAFCVCVHEWIVLYWNIRKWNWENIIFLPERLFRCSNKKKDARDVSNSIQDIRLTVSRSFCECLNATHHPEFWPDASLLFIIIACVYISTIPCILNQQFHHPLTFRLFAVNLATYTFIHCVCCFFLSLHWVFVSFSGSHYEWLCWQFHSTVLYL